MYAPAAFAVSDEEAAAMLRSAGLGALVTGGPDGLFASHLPFLFDQAGARLIGHIAGANPHPEHAPAGSPALIIFQDPGAYVSPSWYRAKREHGRVVPTWNYEAIHVHGRITWFKQPDRLRALLDGLTDRFEGGRPEPWSIEDAPADYIETMLAGVTGVEIAIDRILAKRKLSQNRSEGDRLDVIGALSASASPADQHTAARMQALERSSR